MNYFWIIGLLLAPFLLNVLKNLQEKPRIWLHPLFFLVTIIALFQVGLSWFTLMAIPSFLAFSIITSILFASVLIFIIGFTIKTFKTHYSFMSFKEFGLFAIKKNYFSFLAFGVLLIALILLIFFGQWGTFSDTNAYINAGVYFKNDKYTFDNRLSTLEYYYRFTTSYFSNSVFNSYDELNITYQIIWPLIIYYLFFWTIHWYIEENCKQWHLKYKLIFLAFLSLSYIALSFILLHSLTSGNYEIQSLFVFISFVLAITKKFNYFWLFFLAFPFFSVTALLIGIPILFALLFFNLFKSNLLTFLYTILTFIYLGLNGLSFFFENNNQSLIVVLRLFAGLAFVFALISFPTLFLLSRNYKCIILYKNTLNSYHIYNFLNKPSRTKEWIYFGLYIAIFVLVFFITNSFVLNTISNDLVLAGTIPLFVIFSFYRFYQIHWNKQSYYDPTKWLLFLQIFYIIYVIFLKVFFNFFETNSSSFRVHLSSFAIGYFATYVGLIGTQILYVIDQNYLFFKNKWASKNYYLLKTIPRLTMGICALGILTFAGITAITKTNKANYFKGKYSNFSMDNSISKSDQSFLNFLNQKKINEFFGNNISYSFYSDLKVNCYLNNFTPFSFDTSWENTLYNDFISSDLWMDVIQNKSISKLLYYDFINDTPNVVSNFDFIVQQAINNTNENDKLVPYPYINNKNSLQSLQQRLTKDDLLISGAPDFIILNKKTSYYNELDLIQQFINSTSQSDFVYIGNNLLDSNLFGYQFLNQTDDAIYFFNNKTVNLTDFNFKNF